MKGGENNYAEQQYNQQRARRGSEDRGCVDRESYLHARLGELDGFKLQMAELQAASAAVESKRTELTGHINSRDAKSSNISEMVSRARSGIRAAFGPDSTEYEQAGGTRKSERKPAKRKVIPTPA